MANMTKTAIVTGASQGIGAGLVEAFLKRGYCVVEAALFLTDATFTSGQILQVDGGAHAGKW